ncbi:MAG: hypothetical protein SGPRY_010062, partial [Prymnesium sp.]
MASTNPASSSTQLTLGDFPLELAQAVKEKAMGLLQSEIIKPKAVLPFFTSVQYKSIGGTQLSATCMFCTKFLSSTGCTRLVDHLASCNVCIPAVREQVEKLIDKKMQKRKVKDDAQDEAAW